MGGRRFSNAVGGKGSRLETGSRKKRQTGFLFRLGESRLHHGGKDRVRGRGAESRLRSEEGRYAKYIIEERKSGGSGALQHYVTGIGEVPLCNGMEAAARKLLLGVGGGDIQSRECTLGALVRHKEKTA